MLVLHEMRRRARFLVRPLVGAALTSYFVYHTIEGDRGLRAWRETVQQLRGAKEQLAAVEAERNALARKVGGLDPNHVDPDLLDQQIRSTLDLAAPNEVVIVPPGASAPPR
ncbi:MAG: septum formation initiator family protein [Alphaproteobacteria bacterium]|nr:septum formation initiator family protein [Alphaproteobacteria bacterium]